MRWFPARTARTTVMIDVDRVGMYTFKRGSLKIYNIHLLVHVMCVIRPSKETLVL